MTEEEFCSLKPGDKIAYPSRNIEGIVLKEPGVSKKFYLFWRSESIVVQITIAKARINSIKAVQEKLL